MPAKYRYCSGCTALMRPNTTCQACSRPHGSELKKEHQSARWRKLRAAAIARQPYCSDCGSNTDLTAHHLIYPATSIEQVTVVCRACHTTRTMAPQHE